MQNESETEFHRVYKVSPTQQLTKLTHLLRESGAAVVGSDETDCVCRIHSACCCCCCCFFFFVGVLSLQQPALSDRLHLCLRHINV